MRVVIEVGMNDGQDTPHFLTTPDTVVYGFEPVLEIVNFLHKKYENEPRVNIIQMAVDVENKFTSFNVAGWHNGGCSSLHDFHQEAPSKWSGGEGFNFYYTSKQKVNTIRLDDFCRLYNIQEIDYLHIDAQGNDFNVLKSLGEYIHKVKSGKVEVAYNVPLYQGVDNSFESVSKWLEERGFEYTVDFDHPQHKSEANITFKKK